MRRKLTRKLIYKSKDAFLLSLELYNKPTINYRAESFSLLFSNAWELLLKAHLYDESKGKKLSIFRKKRINKKRESISLDESLKRAFENGNDPVRRNIEYISEIRNEAAHLVILELDPYFSRAFQAGVTNYVKHLNDWFGLDINADLNPGLVSLISDKDRVPDISILKKKYNKEDFNSIREWINKFNDLEKLGHNATLSIKHNIAIMRDPKKADYVISSGIKGKASAIVFEKSKNPDISHPYNRKKAINEIKRRISSHSSLSEYDFESYVYVKGHKKSNNDYYYKGKYSGAAQYSKKLVDEFVEAISKNPKNLERWRSQYGQRRRSFLKINKKTI